MADPEKEVAKEADGQDAKEAFKAALREACDKAVRDNRPAIVDDVFRRYRDIPEEYAGNRDRTYWFFYMTTILKTLGATDGLKVIRELWPATTELETAFLVATGKRLEDEDRDIALAITKIELARACKRTEELVTKALRLGVDHAFQHTLTVLIGECKWCAREVCGAKEAGE